MSFYPELDHLTLKELIDCFQQLPPQGEDPSTFYLEVALLISQQGDAGIDYLYKASDKAETEKLRGIIFALAESSVDRKLLHPLLVSYLDHQEPIIIAEAIDGLRKLQDKDSLQQVLAKLEHPSPYVRGSVLRFIARLYPDTALPLLLESLKDPHFIVRENAADELGELGIPLAIPYLRPLLLDTHPDVQQAAQTAIQNLSDID